MPVTTDEDAAIAAIASLNSLSDDQKQAHTKITSLILGDDATPFIDIHELFALYNKLYFRSLLLPRVEVSWSNRLTSCAGICELVKDDEGKYRRIRLKMSEPLLRYRPQSDTVNTLLHEAIHAYFFVTTKWQHARGDDGTGHGAGFLLLADAISNHGGYEITVYHTFHDEVDSYRTHIWKCDGPCVNQPPYFGMVKRSMNRAPSKTDPWWTKHVAECGGTYTKIAEPEPTKMQLMSMSAKERAGRQKNKIDAWFQQSSRSVVKERNLTVGAVEDKNPTDSSIQSSEINSQSSNQTVDRKRPVEGIDTPMPTKRALVLCPICEARVVDSAINQHLDTEHPA